MNANVGGIDRVARIVAGVVLIALAATGTVGVWGWIGVVPLATGLSGWCPAYLPFGLSTCKMKKCRAACGPGTHQHGPHAARFFWAALKRGCESCGRRCDSGLRGG